MIAPALVAILPGMALTIGAMELASSEIIAGASRLVYGIVQLMLMVFGVAIGMAVAGQVAPQQPSPQTGPWSFYVAIVVVGVGLYIYLSAPRGSLVVADRGRRGRSARAEVRRTLPVTGPRRCIGGGVWYCRSRCSRHS